MAHVNTTLSHLFSTQASPAAAAAGPSTRRTPSAATTSFRQLVTSSSPAATPAANSANATPTITASPSSATGPTAESVFGANPWESNPTGLNPNGTEFSYNPTYFATASTAAKVAQMLGGTVTESNALAPNAQQEPNYMVQMPDGRSINAGLVASFYSHGYPQSYVDNLITEEISGTNS